MKEYIKTRLICAARQFRHNSDNSPDLFNPREGFVVAYDKEEVDSLIKELEATSEPTFQFTIRYMNTYMTMPDVEHFGKTIKLYAGNAGEALKKAKEAVEQPSNTQRLVMEIMSIEEVL